MYFDENLKITIFCEKNVEKRCKMSIEEKARQRTW